jgi:single-strand DNA-binding protein
MYLNKAIVYGNLTRDPELRATPNGMQVCSMSLATNRIYNDRDGNRQESTDYHNVVVFGKTAENCAKYLTKGNGVFVEGRMQTRSWEQDGQKKYRTEIIADRVQFGPKSGGNASPAPTNNSDNSAKEPTVPDYPEEEINPEDIPF